MLAGMLTRKPVRLDDVSDVIREQLFDVDLQGNDLKPGCLLLLVSASVMGMLAFLLMLPQLVKTVVLTG